MFDMAHVTVMPLLVHHCSIVGQHVQQLTVSVRPVPAALMLRMATRTSEFCWNLFTSSPRLWAGVEPSILMNFTFFLQQQ